MVAHVHSGADRPDLPAGLQHVHDIANKEEEYAPGKFYLASEFNLDMAVLPVPTWANSSRGSGGEEKGLEHQGDLPFVSGAMSTAGGWCLWHQYGDVKQSTPRTGTYLWQSEMGTGLFKADDLFIGGKQYSPWWPAAARGPPSFFGKIGQRVLDAARKAAYLRCSNSVTDARKSVVRQSRRGWVPAFLMSFPLPDGRQIKEKSCTWNANALLQPRGS